MRCTFHADRRALAATLLAALAVDGSAHAAVEKRWIVHGLQDLVLLDTDDASRVLSRNEGEPGGVGQLRLWVAGELMPGLTAQVVGRIEGGSGTATGETESEVDQALLRWAPSPGLRLLVDVGKVGSPFGNFRDRSFSDVNPLIGAPDSYDVSYPLGIVVTGQVSRLDYRVAWIDGPMANENYVPEAGAAWRPGVALGVTPFIGFRIGGYATAGPYLGPSVEFALPAGAAWRDFDQEIYGFELKFSRGHFELNGDVAFSRYEVPTTTSDPRGQAWYLEPQYAWTPRLFTAARIERNDYPYIMPIDSTFWIASNATFYGIEAGVGWRFTPDLLVKGSYRTDHWHVDRSLEEILPEGRAVAVALSYRFDVLSWIDRPR